MKLGENSSVKLKGRKQPEELNRRRRETMLKLAKDTNSYYYKTRLGRTNKGGDGLYE